MHLKSIDFIKLIKNIFYENNLLNNKFKRKFSKINELKKKFSVKECKELKINKGQIYRRI